MGADDAEREGGGGGGWEGRGGGGREGWGGVLTREPGIYTLTQQQMNGQKMEKGGVKKRGDRQMVYPGKKISITSRLRRGGRGAEKKRGRLRREQEALKTKSSTPSSKTFPKEISSGEGGKTGEQRSNEKKKV